MAFRSLVAVVLAMVLVGCAPTVLTPGPTPPPTPSDTPASRSHPQSGFAGDCTDVVDPVAAAEVVGGPLTATADSYVAISTWGARAAAILQRGGLTCVWETTEYDERLRVLALPDARVEFGEAVAAIDATEHNGNHLPTDVADGGLVRCQPSDEVRAAACDWTVAVGDIWLFVRTAGLADSDVVSPPPNPDTSIPPTVVAPGSRAAELVSDIASTLATLDRVDILPTAGGQLPECEELIAPDRVASALGIDPSEVSVYPGDRAAQRVGAGAAGDGIVMSFFAAEMLGYRSCAGSHAETSWTVVLAPDAAWLTTYPLTWNGWQQHGGSGSVSFRCGSDEGGSSCDYAVLTGDDLRLLTLFGSDDPAIAEALGSVLTD